MNLIRKVVNFIDDKEIKLTINSNKIHIVNHIEIVRFDEKVILIKYREGSINISGDTLMISRLINDEILITGHIKTIEFGG